MTIKIDGISRMLYKDSFHNELLHSLDKLLLEIFDNYNDNESHLSSRVTDLGYIIQMDMDDVYSCEDIITISNDIVDIHVRNVSLPHSIDKSPIYQCILSTYKRCVREERLSIILDK